MIVSWAIDVGGSFPVSARTAVHTSFFRRGEDARRALREDAAAQVWIDQYACGATRPKYHGLPGGPGAPGCTALELLGLELRDDNRRIFATPGIYLPRVQ